MDGLTEGRIVHYVLNSGRHAGEHRPAVIVKVWRQNDGNGGEMPPANGCSNLQVFTDSDKDSKCNDELPPVMWATSATYDESGKPGTWHWIEKA